MILLLSLAALLSFPAAAASRQGPPEDIGATPGASAPESSIEGNFEPPAAGGAGDVEAVPGVGRSATRSFVEGGAILIAAGVACWVIRRRRLHRPDTVRLTGKESSDEGVLILICGMTLFLGWNLGGASAHALTASEVETPGLRELSLLSLGALVGAGLALAVLTFVQPRMVAAADLRMRLSDFRTGLLAFLLIAPLVMAVNLAMRLLSDVVGSEQDLIQHSLLQQISDETASGWWWVTIAMTIITTPIYEEVLFRGFLQTSLLRMTRSPKWAIVGTSVVFVLMHAGAAELWGFPALFVLSLGFGVAMERTGRIAAPILMHACFNAMNIGLALLLT